MISNKLLEIKECYFNLPDNFKGSLGEALMLLAQYRLECEKNQKIKEENSDVDCYNNLMKSNDKKCNMKYAMYQISEDGLRWEKIYPNWVQK